MPIVKLLKVPYDDFKHLEVILPDQFDANNQAIVNHVDGFVDGYNDLETLVVDSNNQVVTANTKSDSAIVKADGAIVTANLADSKADGAIITANNADTKSDGAIITANEANTKSDNALETANIANGIAFQAVIDANIAAIAAQSAVGNTDIKYEVYTIVNANNGDGTFTYKDVNNVEVIEAITPEGYQAFQLVNGQYPLAQNRVEMIVNDTLNRSVASGGLVELSNTRVALTQTEGAGAELTIKYYEKVGLAGTHKLSHGVGQNDEVAGLVARGSEQPNSTTAYWIKVIV